MQIVAANSHLCPMYCKIIYRASELVYWCNQFQYASKTATKTLFYNELFRYTYYDISFSNVLFRT